MPLNKLYVHITVNTSRGEFDYRFEKTDSLDAILARAIEMHPSATSAVISVVADVDGNSTIALHGEPNSSQGE